MRFLDSIRPVEPVEPVEPGHPSILRATIEDDWGIVYSQGGVVLAAMLRAAETVLDRPDLRPVSASATFLRPVRCGPIDLRVEVLRSGRSGAQTLVTVHDPADDDPTPNLRATLVCAVHDPTFPSGEGLVSPFGPGTPAPLDCPRIGLDVDGQPTMAFFRRTDWRDATSPGDDHLHRRVWFSFSDEPASDDPWDVALLAIPGDALGLAATPSAAAAVGPLTSPTLELSLQFHSPARGRWIGIDTRCHRSNGGITAGVATLWNRDGSLIATAAQTALLRRLSR